MKLVCRKLSDELGTGPPLTAWRPPGVSLAVAGSNCNVYIIDRTGQVIDTIEGKQKVIDIRWDTEGDVLAIIRDNLSDLILYDANQRRCEIIDVSMGSKELPTAIAWSAFAPLLALGTCNGNLFIYNHHTSRKIPIIGKHQRRITGVAIAPDQHIVCGSDDNTITVSTIDGETLHTAPVQGDPTNLTVGILKRNNGAEVTMVCAQVTKQILHMSTIDELDKCTNLRFLDRYGNITIFQWYNDGFVVVGFERGVVCTISTVEADIGVEVASWNEFNGHVRDLDVCVATNRIYSIGDMMLKSRPFHAQDSMQTMAIELDVEKEVDTVRVSADGALVAVTSTGGTLLIYMTKLRTLGASFMSSTAVLTSLQQVTIIVDGDKSQKHLANLKVEPTLLALGPRHVAVAASNRAWFYEYERSRSVVLPSSSYEATLVAECEYLSTVQQLHLNDEFAAVSMDGKVRLHKIIDGEEDVSMTFPEPSRNSRVSASALTPNFLIFSTESQYLVFFSLEEWAVVSEYRHTSPIRMISPDPDGLRICIFDERMDTWVYSPLDDSMNKLPTVGSVVHYKGALWESFTIDRDTFVVFDSSDIYVFLYSRGEPDGQRISYIGTTKIPPGHEPLLLNKAIVQCLTTNGLTVGLLLDSHRADLVTNGKTVQQVREQLNQALTLRRWPYSWRLCEAVDDLGMWNTFAQAALQNYDVALAQRIFRRIGDVSMVMALQQMLHIEEKTLLAAEVSVLLEKFDHAEKLFLSSSKPIEALNLRRDLLDWSRALQLAEQLAPDQIPYISKEYAQQLEMMSDFPNALAHYERAILETEEQTEHVIDHNEACQAGVARMSIRTGDIRRGLELARQLEGRQVKKECAIALEKLKQYSEAADLYELGQYYDRAAAVCLKAKAWGKVAELLPKVRSPKIHAQFGRVMEADKKYKQAAIAYRNARDYDNLVRMLLDHLDMADEAVKVVRESRSVEGAKLVAKFFSNLGDHSSAIQFLVLSQCHNEAFQVAEAYDKMKDFAEAIQDSGTPEQFLQLASYFANSGDNYNAGKFYNKGGQHHQAIDHLLAAGDSQEALLEAIKCVASAEDKALTERLTSYLLGEVDGNPKDAQFLFRMFVALGRTKDAAKTAVVIAREEQGKGQYRVARDVLLAMYQDLRSKDLKIPQDMYTSLMLLHSYMIVKDLVHRQENLRAARMLLRVASNISRFPAHTVQILTSAVVMCTKSGLKAAAHQCAVQLMAPELRKKIDSKYRKKIEAIVRKADKTVDPEEPKSACPFCSFLISETELVCPSCKNTIPYCILTGRHIVIDDFAICTSCEFPGYFSEFKKLASAGEGCTMCGSSLNDVIPGDCQSYLKLEK